MSSPQNEVVVKRRIAAPCLEVWRALTDPAQRRQWWSYMDLVAEEGSGFEESWFDSSGQRRTTRGTILAVDPPHRLRMSWSDDGWPADTTVELNLVSDHDHTIVQLRHDGWEHLPDGGGLAAEHGDGWRAHIDHLQEFVEGRAGGPD